MNITCFISHSWRNGEHDFADKLADALESHGVTKAWIDGREIPGGGHIPDCIIMGVQTSDVFLFVMSPNAVASEWCRLELKEAIEQRSETGIQIIPILLKQCSIPEELRDLLHVDFRGEARFEEALKKLLVSIRDAYRTRATVLELLDSDSWTRFEAAQKLASLKNRFTAPILARYLEIDPDPTVRYWMAVALGQIGGKEVHAVLQGAMEREVNEFAKLGIAEGLQRAASSN